MSTASDVSDALLRMSPAQTPFGRGSQGVPPTPPGMRPSPALPADDRPSTVPGWIGLGDPAIAAGPAGEQSLSSSSLAASAAAGRGAAAWASRPPASTASAAAAAVASAGSAPAPQPARVFLAGGARAAALPEPQSLTSFGASQSQGAHESALEPAAGAEPPRHRTVNEFTPGVSVVDARAERRAAAVAVGSSRRRESVDTPLDDTAVAAEAPLAPRDAALLGNLLAGLSWPRSDRDLPDVEGTFRGGHSSAAAAAAACASNTAGGVSGTRAVACPAAAAAGPADAASAASPLGTAASLSQAALPGLLQLGAGALRIQTGSASAPGGQSRGRRARRSARGAGAMALARRSSSSGSSLPNGHDDADDAVDIPRRRRVSRLLGWAARALEVRRRAMHLATCPALRGSDSAGVGARPCAACDSASTAAPATADVAGRGAAATERREGGGANGGAEREASSWLAGAGSAGSARSEDEDAASVLSSIADLSDRLFAHATGFDAQRGPSDSRGAARADGGGGRRRAAGAGAGAGAGLRSDWTSQPGASRHSASPDRVSRALGLVALPSPGVLASRLSDEAAILRLRQAVLGTQAPPVRAARRSGGDLGTSTARGPDEAGPAARERRQEAPGASWIAGLAAELGWEDVERGSSLAAAAESGERGGRADDHAGAHDISRDDDDDHDDDDDNHDDDDDNHDDDDGSDLSSSEDSFEELDAADDDDDGPGHESGESILRRLAQAAARAGRAEEVARLVGAGRRGGPEGHRAVQRGAAHRSRVRGSAPIDVVVGPSAADFDMPGLFVDSGDDDLLEDDEEDYDEEGSAGRDAESVVSGDIPVLGEPLLDMLPQVLGEDGEVMRLMEAHRRGERAGRTVARPLVLPGRLRPMGETLAAAASEAPGRAGGAGSARRGRRTHARSLAHAIPLPEDVPLPPAATPGVLSVCGPAGPSAAAAHSSAEAAGTLAPAATMTEAATSAAPAAAWVRSALSTWPEWSPDAASQPSPAQLQRAALTALDQCLTGAWDRHLADECEAPSANPRSLKPLASLLSFADVVTVLKATLGLRCSIRQRLLDRDFDGAAGLLLSRVPFLAGRMVAGIVAEGAAAPAGPRPRGAGGLLLVRLACAAVLQRAAKSADFGSCFAELARRVGPMVGAIEQGSPDHLQASVALSEAVEALAWASGGSGGSHNGKLEAALRSATDVQSLADQCNRTVVNGFVMLRAQRRLADAVGATGRAHRRRRRDAVATAAALQRASARVLPWGQAAQAAEAGSAAAFAMSEPLDAADAPHAHGHGSVLACVGAVSSSRSPGAPVGAGRRTLTADAAPAPRAPRLAEAALTLHLMRWPARIEGPLPTSALERAVKHTVLVRHLLWVASGCRGPRFAIPTAEEAALALAA